MIGKTKHGFLNMLGNNLLVIYIYVGRNYLGGLLFNNESQSLHIDEYTDHKVKIEIIETLK